MTPHLVPVLLDMMEAIMGWIPPPAPPMPPHRRGNFGRTQIRKPECPNCGAPDDGSTFCSYCKTQLHPIVPQPRPTLAHPVTVGMCAGTLTADQAREALLACGSAVRQGGWLYNQIKALDDLIPE